MTYGKGLRGWSRMDLHRSPPYSPQPVAAWPLDSCVDLHDAPSRRPWLTSAWLHQLHCVNASTMFTASVCQQGATGIPEGVIHSSDLCDVPEALEVAPSIIVALLRIFFEDFRLTCGQTVAPDAIDRSETSWKCGSPDCLIEALMYAQVARCSFIEIECQCALSPKPGRSKRRNPHGTAWHLIMPPQPKCHMIVGTSNVAHGFLGQFDGSRNVLPLRQLCSLSCAKSENDAFQHSGHLLHIAL
eukprot:450229-Amphidinium_carterae.1